MNTIPPSELIINPDGSIYHLKLKPGEIAHDIITVGDPDRVDAVTQHFSKIEIQVSKREFKTVTGIYKGKRLTVISTGIGTDNIDIVLTELDALVNVDFGTRKRKLEHTQLRFYRIGTSGALREDIPIDSIIVSQMAIGLEGLMHYYEWSPNDIELRLTQLANENIGSIPGISAYGISASLELADRFSFMGQLGITVTATGFYGPQGRSVIGRPKSASFLDDLKEINLEELKCTNLEMETAGIYGMARLLGHQAISINAILANRISKTFSDNPFLIVNKMIRQGLEIIVEC